MSLRKNVLLIAAIGSAALASSAWPQTMSEEAARDITRQMTQGEKDLARAQTFKNASSRLEVMDVAIGRLRRARSQAVRHESEEGFDKLRCGVDAALVNALDDEGEIFYARSSYWQAGKRVGEALTIAPNDERSMALMSAIDQAKNRQYGYSSHYGDRMRQRTPGPVTPSNPTMNPRY